MDTHHCAGGLGIHLLNPSNYKVWRTCMESYLVGEGLWDVVDGNDVQIPEAAAGNWDAISKWKRLNAKAEFALKRSISYSLFDDIMGCKSAHEIWGALDGLFGKSDDEAKSAASEDKDQVSPSQDLSDATVKGDYDEAKSAARGDEDHVRRSRDLYDATVKGDWKAAESIFQEDQSVLGEGITLRGETALHVAINFGHAEFVEKLVALMPVESLEKQEQDWGLTALHYAVISENFSTVEALVKRHVKLVELVDRVGRTPLLFGTYVYQSKEILWYLTLKIPHEIPFKESPFFTGSRGDELMNNLVSSRYYDICLHLLEKYPSLSIAKGEDAQGMLLALIHNPFDFQTGGKLSFWERCIYKFISMESYHKQERSFSRSDLEDQRAQPPPMLLQSMLAFLKEVMHMINGAFWTKFEYLVPAINRIKDEKYNNYCTEKIVKIACEQISHHSKEEILSFFMEESLIQIATVHGIAEFVTTCLGCFPFLKHNIGINILEAAIINRKEKVFNLLLGAKGIMYHVARIHRLSIEENLLHTVARLAPYPQLSSVSCPALQMQRELQWYKVVEKFVSPLQRTIRSKEHNLPHEIFTNDHRGLLKDAEKWMKDTSNSCMVVATLIATVVFAAVFTVPGGNFDGKGIPLFLEEKAFMVFAISDALALFSSTTSILMFLSILTARYAEEDFLRALPKRLILGFASLFIAIATMMVAFGATLYMVLSERFKWIFIPIIDVTSIPIALFIMLQLPLFIFMVRSTYGFGIFHPIEI